MTLVNKIENRITFKINAGSYFDLLTPETTKLLGSTKSKKNVRWEQWKCALFRKNSKVILIHCNVVNNSYQQTSRVL